MRILIATEKPSSARAIAPLARAHWPGANITFFNVVPYANILHRYPRGLKMSDCPHIGPYQTRLQSWQDWRCLPLAMQADGELALMEQADPSLITDADLVVYACDPDPTGAMGFAILMEQLLGPERTRQCPAMWVSGMDSVSIAKGLSDMAPFGDVAEQALSAGRIKRHFDWNWNTNSLMVFSQLMRQLGAPHDAPPLSKYALQLLYAMRERPSMRASKIIELMHKWPGTGRYTNEPGAQNVHLGGAGSMFQIIENLGRAGLLDGRQENDDAPSFWQISARGQALLESLHPDCEDPDLPYRLDTWVRDGEASLPAVDRYIRTFFGKQLRFSRSGT